MWREWRVNGLGFWILPLGPEHRWSVFSLLSFSFLSFVPGLPFTQPWLQLEVISQARCPYLWAQVGQMPYLPHILESLQHIFRQVVSVQYLFQCYAPSLWGELVPATESGVVLCWEWTSPFYFLIFFPNGRCRGVCVSKSPCHTYVRIWM